MNQPCQESIQLYMFILAWNQVNQKWNFLLNYHLTQGYFKESQGGMGIVEQLSAISFKPF